MSDTPLPTEEQKQRAKWDLLLLDLEHRTEQIRGARQDSALKPWQAVSAGLTAGAAILGVGIALGRWVLG